MSTTINCPREVNLTKGQEAALRYVHDVLCSDRGGAHPIEYTVDVQGTDYGTVWFKVEQDIPTLGEGNMLRFLTKCDSWFIAVGPRGGMAAKSYPNYAKGEKKIGKISIG